MATWESYIDNMMAQGAHRCGIYVQNTNQPCAQSGLDLTADEIQGIKSCRDKKAFEFVINKKKCVLINVNESTVQGKTKEPDDDGNKYFYHCEFSTEMIIVAGKQGSGERKACGIAESIARHLINVNR